jgi:hypothetical protein
MTDEPDVGQAHTEAGEEMHDEAHEPPRGTLIIMLVYLVILIGIWGSIYLTLLQRGS